MAYSGSTSVGSGLSPRGGNFPIVNAANVYAKDGQSVADVIANYTSGTQSVIPRVPAAAGNGFLKSVNGEYQIVQIDAAEEASF